MPSTPTTDTRERVLALTQTLITEPSVTPEDGQCQALLTERLQALGFECEQIDRNGVKNLWASRGHGGPHLLLAGHTDVVPSGPVAEWCCDPFTPTVIDNRLYGRGAADMKSSLAAMIVATENYLADHPDSAGTLSFLITSDEEGDAIDGTRYAVDVLRDRGICPDYCIVGEPSSSNSVGDVVRCGRRGSINATLVIQGVQGHVAYPQDADNPVHRALTALLALTQTRWDEGNDYYPPTSLQISNIQAGTGATNVIPGTLEVKFNLRFSSEQTSQRIIDTVAKLLDEHDLNYEIEWRLSGNPFITEAGTFTDIVSRAIAAQTGLETELSTSGGTSDGRFIAPWGSDGHRVDVVELGPVNATIHKIDEHVAIDDLPILSNLYETIIADVLAL